MDEKSKEVHRRWLQNTRFRWHEAVLKDPVIHKHPSAIALAGHVMHRYDVGKGYAQFSIASAEKALEFDQRTLKRVRKLLLNKHELLRFVGRSKERGLTMVPLRVYFAERGRAKCVIALCKGKKLHDKRETLKKADAGREMDRIMKSKRFDRNA